MAVSPQSQQPQQPKLPPVGPAWAGTLMGTSIASTLSLIHGWTWLAYGFLVIATVVLAVLSIGWLRHRNPGFHQEFMGPWGMVAMGVLALGAAWTGVTGMWIFQLIAYAIALPLGLITCLWQLRKFSGAPTFLWGLGLVAPMVAATSGGQLSAAGVLPRAFWVISVGCFALSFLTAVPTFARVYLALIRRTTSIPASMAGSTWIPLGIAGQSTAAAQVLFFGDKAAVIYGTTFFVVAIPMFIYAAYRYWGAAFTWANYSPAWWGATFPIGTMSLGCHYLSLATGLGWWDALSKIFLALVIIHLSLNAVRALKTA